MQERSFEKVLNKHENLVGKFLFIIGIAQMVLGIIFGLVFSIVPEYEYFDFEMDMDPVGTMDFEIFVIYVLGGFISGMLFVGFSEVIKLLDNMNKGLKEMVEREKISSDLESEKADCSSMKWTVNDTNQEKIYKLYPAESVMEITPAQLEGYYIVKLMDNDGEIVKKATKHHCACFYFLV